MQDRILHMFENQEVEQESQELSNTSQQETLEIFSEEKKKKPRYMSEATKYVLRTNGLLQQRVMIEYALRENARAFENAVAAHDEAEMRRYELFIEKNRHDIEQYDAVVQDQLQMARDLGFTVKQNPETGRYIIVAGPPVDKKPAIISINAQTQALITEYFDQLHEFESAALEFLQEEFKSAVAEGRYEQTAEFAAQMKEIKNRISIIEKHRDGLLKLFAKK